MHSKTVFHKIFHYFYTHPKIAIKQVLCLKNIKLNKSAINYNSVGITLTNIVFFKANSFIWMPYRTLKLMSPETQFHRFIKNMKQNVITL